MSVDFALMYPIPNARVEISSEFSRKIVPSYCSNDKDLRIKQNGSA